MLPVYSGDGGCRGQEGMRKGGKGWEESTGSGCQKREEDPCGKRCFLSSQGTGVVGYRRRCEIKGWDGKNPLDPDEYGVLCFGLKHKKRTP